MKLWTLPSLLTFLFVSSGCVESTTAEANDEAVDVAGSELGAVVVLEGASRLARDVERALPGQLRSAIVSGVRLGQRTGLLRSDETTVYSVSCLFVYAGTRPRLSRCSLQEITGPIEPLTGLASTAGTAIVEFPGLAERLAAEAPRP